VHEGQGGYKRGVHEGQGVNDVKGVMRVGNE
jgi:hypothetical protein